MFAANRSLSIKRAMPELPPCGNQLFGLSAAIRQPHAQDILADLVNTVVTNVRPMFRLAKLEGDAAFVYAITESIDGPLLQDTIERMTAVFGRPRSAKDRAIADILRERPRTARRG